MRYAREVTCPCSISSMRAAAPRPPLSCSRILSEPMGTRRLPTLRLLARQLPSFCTTRLNQTHTSSTTVRATFQRRTQPGHHAGANLDGAAWHGAVRPGPDGATSPQSVEHLPSSAKGRLRAALSCFDARQGCAWLGGAANYRRTSRADFQHPNSHPTIPCR